MIAASSVVDPIALPIGVLLIDTGAMVPLLYGTQGVSERTAVSIPVPLLPMLQGVVIGLQAISVDPTTLAAELTNPAVVVLY